MIYFFIPDVKQRFLGNKDKHVRNKTERQQGGLSHDTVFNYFDASAIFIVLKEAAIVGIIESKRTILYLASLYVLRQSIF